MYTRQKFDFFGNLSNYAQLKKYDMQLAKT